MVEYPTLVFAVALIAFSLSACAGASFAKRSRRIDEDDRSDLGMILTASLTLLALIIGFTFSMAVTRFDRRKTVEAEEANAIGTELYRVGLMPPQEVDRVREVLKRYLKQRILFYTTRNSGRLQQINQSTAEAQAALWSAVQEHAARQPAPIAALVVSGMNDVLNAQGYTQAAWWNRIPVPAWVLMTAIAIFCNALLGYTSHHTGANAKRLFLFPLVVAVSFFLIADIDSPRGGIIRIEPVNLEAVSCP